MNRIQPFEAANFSAAFFLFRPMRKNNRCHIFFKKLKTTFHALLLCILICGLYNAVKGLGAGIFILAFINKFYEEKKHF